MPGDHEVLLANFRVYLYDQGFAENTVRCYLHDIRTFFAWFEETNDEPCGPDSLTSIDMKEYRGWCQSRHYSPKTVNRRLHSLSRLIKYFEHEQLVGKHHMLKVPKEIRQGRRGPRWLDRKEALSLQRAAEAHCDEIDVVLVSIFLNTGLRVTELARLEWPDVALKERVGQVVVREGKGSKSRIVPLNNEARSAFRRLLKKEWKEHSNPMEQAHRSGDLVIGFGVRSIQKRVKRVAIFARLDDCTPHSLRHTFAKSLLDQGVELTEVSALLGHESLETTRIYVTPSTRDLAKAVEKIGADS